MPAHAPARVSGVALLSVLVLGACGGPPPQPPTAPATKPIVTEPLPARVDLSPVPSPAGLVAFGRAKKPEEALKVIGRWTGLPMPGGEFVSEIMLGEQIGRVVDLSHPIDFAVVFDGKGHSMKPLMALSAGVRSMDEAKAAIAPKGKLEEWNNGAFRVTGLGPPSEEERDAHPCVLAPSVGSAQARLVCADSDAALSALVPYLTRTAPKETTSSDVHLTLRTEPVREVVTQLRGALPALLGLGGRSSGPPVLREMVESMLGDAVDLVGDLDTVDVDFDLADAGANATATAHFRSTTSLLARIATAHPERSDVPPAAFWHLPADTDVAFFHRGVDDKELTHAKQLVDAVILAAFEEAGVPDVERRPLADVAMRSIALLENPLVFGKGIDVAALQKAQAATKSAKPDDVVAQEEARRAMKEASAGWYVFGYGDPAQKVAQPLKDWVSVWNHPKLQEFMKDKRGKDAPPVTMKLTAAPKGMPKDTVHFELSVPTRRYDMHAPDGTLVGPVGIVRGAKPAAKLPAPKPTVLHVVVVPDGTRSWVGFGLDATSLAGKLGATLASAPEAATIAKRQGLDALRDGKMGAAGFVTLRGFVTGLPIRDALRSEGFADPLKTANDKQGVVPAPFTLTAEPATGGAPPNFVARAKLSKEAVGEIVRFVMRDGRF